MRHVNLTVFLLCILAVFLTNCLPENSDTGEKLYATHCANCHMADGRGLRRLIPPIAQSDYLVKHRLNLPCLIKHGAHGPMQVNGQEFNYPMPGAENLADDQITNLLNYIQTNFGNTHERFTIPEVTNLLETCPPHNH